MIASWRSRFCLVMLLLCVAVSVRAQRDDGVLSVQDGDRLTPIARLVAGQWMSDVTCVPADSTVSSGPLRVSGVIRASAVRAVMPASQEWLGLAPTIIELFERREREQHLSDRASDGPRAVDWIYASEIDGRRMYYYEASRRVSSVSADIDQDTDPPGTVRIAVAGFLHDDQGPLIPLGTKSELRWEQDGLPRGPRRPDLMPLGVIVRGERHIWVMNGQSGTSRWFALYDVSSAGIRTVLTARADRC